MTAPQDLSIRQLQYVVAVAETLGFHRAAEREHVSQPTLSVQIRELEDVLGVRLFERDRKRVLVTPAGHDVVAHARRVLLALGDLVTAAVRLRDPFDGTLRVGVIPTVAPYLLPRLMPEAAARYPRLHLALKEEKTAEVVRDLNDGSLDAAIVATGIDGLEPFASAAILEDPFVAAMPPDHPLAKKKVLALADLEDERVLLLDDGHCFRTHALSLCAKAGARETDVRATSLSTLVQMVSTGRGMTLLPTLALAVENRRAQLVVRPLRAPAPARTIALVWRKEAPLEPALRALAETFADAARAGDAEAEAARGATAEVPGARPLEHTESPENSASKRSSRAADDGRRHGRRRAGGRLASRA